MAEFNSSESKREIILRQLTEIARTLALTEMANGIAHELNQPLGAIATFSQAGERMLDRADPLVTNALEVFRQISIEAIAAADGIQRIRHLFEPTSSQRTYCQLPDLIAELLPVFNPLSSRQSVQVDVPGPVPGVLIDRLRIQHVLCALTQNAAEATSPGSAPCPIRIDVTADRYCVETGVSDSGPGIPADMQGRLFRPFFTTKPHGAGLGLASSRAIIESHEGSMGFDNLPAGGSRFWFRLPIVQG